MMNEEVRKIMTTDPVTVTPDQNVEEVSYLMLKQHLQQLPVVKDGEFMGIITTYDLWKQYENKTTLKDLCVKDVMNTKVVRISPIDKVGTAAELFADRRFKTIPVVNLDNQFKGVVTAFDVIREAFNSEYNHPILYNDKFERKDK
jgi:CBS domain-containing protein